MSKQPKLPLQDLEAEHKDQPFNLVRYLRLNLTAGVLILLPALATFYIFYVLVIKLDGWLLGFIPEMYQPNQYLPFPVPGVGLIGGAVFLFLIGMITRNVLGRQMVNWSEKLAFKIPGVETIYSAIQQVIETLTNSSQSFREVVLLEYPRKGVWSMGFVTSRTKGVTQKLIEADVVNVFVPTTPNPTSGFLLFVPKDELKHLDMTVEQGLKMLISAGMVTPTEAEAKAALKEEAKAKKESENGN